MADIKAKRAKEWQQSNPVLRTGEPGLDRTSGRMKIGDGKTRWNDLNFVTSSSSADGGGGAAPSGALPVYATDDQAVADANPSYAWIVFESDSAPAPAPGDTTAPTVPAGLTATPSDGQVSLSWSASTDAVGVTGYRVYRGGTLISSPSGTSYVDTGRTNGTQYSYTVAAADAAGNLSAQTSAVTATPAAAGPAAGTVIASDDFNRTNNTNIGSTPVGTKTWAEFGNTFADGAQIVSNRLQLTSATTQTAAFTTVDAGVTDMDVSATLAALPTVAGRETGVVARFLDINNYILWMTNTWTLGNGYTLRSVVNGTGTDLGFSSTAPVPAGSVLRLVVKGTTATTYLNGTQIYSVTIPAADAAATKGGFHVRDNSFAVQYDDFSVKTA